MYNVIYSQSARFNKLQVTLQADLPVIARSKSKAQSRGFIFNLQFPLEKNERKLMMTLKLLNAS